MPGLDWKTSLQEVAAAVGLGRLSTASASRAPTMRRSSTPASFFGDEVLGEGRGRSKKEAEQKAAKEAWHTLDARRSARAEAAAETASDRPGRV